MGTLVSRARPARVIVSAQTVRIGTGKSMRSLARDDIAVVEAIGTAGVKLMLRDGTSLRLAFDGDRLREWLMSELGVAPLSAEMASHPRVAVSGVRMTASVPPPGLDEDTGDAVPDSGGAVQSSRARRLG